MTTLVLGAATLVALLLIAVFVTERMLRDSVFTAALIVGLRLEATFMGSWDPTPVIADFTVVPQDVLFVLAAGCGVLRLLRIKKLTPTQLIIVALLALVLVGGFRGLGPNGIQDTARESRNFLYFFGGALYFSTIDPTEDVLRRIGRIWIIAAGLFGAIVLFRWGAFVAGAPPVGIFTRDMEAGGIRVIDAQNTLVVLEGMFLIAILWLRGRASQNLRRLLIALIPIVIFLQHRTIWVIAVVATIVVAVGNPRFGRRALALIVSCAAVVGIVTTALSTDSDFVPRNPTDSGTIVWRFEGWKGLVTERDAPPLDVAIGTPLGSGYAREIDLFEPDQVVDTSPHNFYVQMYLRVGLIGVVLFPLLWFPTMLRFRRREDREDPVPEILFTLLAMQAVFMIAWTLDFDQGIITGVAGAVAYRRGRGHGPNPAEEPAPELATVTA